MSKLKVRAVNEHSKLVKPPPKCNKMVSTIVLEKIQGRTEHYRTKKKGSSPHCSLSEAELCSPVETVVSSSEKGAGLIVRLCVRNRPQTEEQTPDIEPPLAQMPRNFLPLRKTMCPLIPGARVPRCS